jgi:hypothetical protein
MSMDFKEDFNKDHSVGKRIVSLLNKHLWNNWIPICKKMKSKPPLTP